MVRVYFIGRWGINPGESLALHPIRSLAVHIAEYVGGVMVRGQQKYDYRYQSESQHADMLMGIGASIYHDARNRPGATS